MDKKQIITASTMMTLTIGVSIFIDIAIFNQHSIQYLAIAILIWILPVGAFIAFIADPLGLLNYHRYQFFVASDHDHRFLGNNIFDGAVILKTKKIIKYKRFLKDKVVEPTFKVMSNQTLNIVFIVYELKNDIQLVKIKSSYQARRFKDNPLVVHQKQCQDSDYNYNLLAKKYPPTDLEDNEEYIEKTVSEDKRVLFTIRNYANNVGTEFYAADLYIAGLWLSINRLKKDFKNLFPHYSFDCYYLHEGFSSESLEETRKYVAEEMKRIEEILNKKDQA